MGHSEPASGLCSLAKIVISMENGKIPANLHFANPNPDIPALLNGKLQVHLINYNNCCKKIFLTLMTCIHRW